MIELTNLALSVRCRGVNCTCEQPDWAITPCITGIFFVSLRCTSKEATFFCSSRQSLLNVWCASNIRPGSKSLTVEIILPNCWFFVGFLKVRIIWNSTNCVCYSVKWLNTESIQIGITAGGKSEQTTSILLSWVTGDDVAVVDLKIIRMSQKLRWFVTRHSPHSVLGMVIE